ncbi:hypothetical protein LA324_05340 [Corynebacterium coyleae]|uniref:hypothetical protein n=1 Tax=Corynebacterium coyleae TaxID=53374 RepID=UPI001CC9AFAE|nr:hypothetical protein [Corynebacterium coyleae]UBI10034.1 hypothetical protein LA324_05340 [Corynebacterium coyleae]
MNIKNATVVATILDIKRLASSNLGNPRYALITDKGTFNTRANSSIGYMVCGNWVGRTVAMRFDGRPSMRGIGVVTDEVSPFAAALIANGVLEKHAIMWADANELRAGSYMQDSLDITEEARMVNAVYHGISV